MNPQILLNNFKQNIGDFVSNSVKNFNQSNDLTKNKNEFLKNIYKKEALPNNQALPNKLELINGNLKAKNSTTNDTNSRFPSIQMIEKKIVQSDYNGLEAKVESINEKLNRLENRVDKDEKITESTQNDIKDLKINLDKNFNKLDTILEKLATKLN